jgi:hypothetical protein
MPRLLIVHHTPSPALQEMFEAAVGGARTDEIEGVEVVIRPALTAAAVDVLEADGYLLGTSANIGYMSGALKHFFDGIYYPCLEATQRRPYGLYVHGASDTGGAVRAVESIATGLGWRKVRPAVSVTGPPGKADLEACWELGALLAAEVAGPLGRPGHAHAAIRKLVTGAFRRAGYANIAHARRWHARDEQRILALYGYI